MYTCSKCKKEFEDLPAFNNACGSFCNGCKAEIHAASAAGLREKNKATYNGHCVWCGDCLNETNMQSGKTDENVCQSCAKKRDWLLKAIRLSDRPYKYVSRTEERERPQREERNRMIIAANAKQEKPLQPELPSDAEARMRRLELMLNKLTSALGV